MTDEKVKKVCDLYFDKLETYGPPEKIEDLSAPVIGWLQTARHIRWMAQETKKFIDGNRREKAMRWLGWMQGALSLMGIYSIFDTMTHNMPPNTVVDTNE